MKILFELFPLLVLFVLYKLTNWTIAICGMAAAYGLVILLHYLLHRRFERMQCITFFMVAIAATLSVVFASEQLFMWKTTLSFWLFAIVIIASQWIGREVICQRIGKNFTHLPDKNWSTLNFAWGIFFAILGILNWWVAENYSTDAWVNFKLFMLPPITLLFTIGSIVYVHKVGYLHDQQTTDSSKNDK